MEVISSTANPRIKDAATLQRRRVRRERGQHLVEGPHAVEAAVNAGVVTQLFCLETFDFTELGAAADQAKADATCVAPHVLAKLADTPAPQGVVAVATTPADTTLARLRRGVVVVADINDPGNVGTIIRTAEASGAAGVILPHGAADPYSPKALRSAAGSTYRMPLLTGLSVDELVDHATHAGWHLAVCDASGTDDVNSFTPNEDVTLLCFGHETHGVNPQLVAAANSKVAVTMFGAAESLNVSAAAAIATYTLCAWYRTRSHAGE